VEQPLRERVFGIFAIAALIIAGIFIARIFVMSGVKGAEYFERAQMNVHQNIPLIAPRGTITDRNGAAISKNKSIFAVFLDVNQMIKASETEAVLDATEKVLGLGRETVLSAIQSTNLESITDVIVANDITREQAIAIEGLTLKSLNVEQSYRRDYVNPAYAHLIGYVGLVSKDDLRNNEKLILNDYIGRTGLEMQYDDLLRGKNGAVAIFRNSTGNVEEIIRTEEPVQGATLKTTVDAELQEFFYSRMLQALLSLGRKSGAGIALNPQNGDILALISFPSFDGDNVSEFLNKGGRPLFNRAVSGVYSPGSTIKPIHAAAALQESVVSPGDQIYSAGYIEIPNPYNPTAE